MIPLSETITITQMHVPVDDTHTYWYSFFTSFAAPLDKEAMRDAAPGSASPCPTTRRSRGRHNHWGFDAGRAAHAHLPRHGRGRHQPCTTSGRSRAWARSRTARASTSGTSDKVIMANRRMLLKAIETVRAGGGRRWRWTRRRPRR